MENRLLDSDEVSRSLGQLPRWREPRNFLEDLAERTSILGPHDGPDADWSYLHRTFREALAARVVSATVRARGPPPGVNPRFS